MSGISIPINNHDSLKREHKLELELQEARKELNHLRRAVSLVDQHHQREALSDTRSMISSPSNFLNRQNYSTHSTNSTLQRSYYSHDNYPNQS